MQEEGLVNLNNIKDIELKEVLKACNNGYINKDDIKNILSEQPGYLSDATVMEIKKGLENYKQEVKDEFSNIINPLFRKELDNDLNHNKDSKITELVKAEKGSYLEKVQQLPPSVNSNAEDKNTHTAIYYAARQLYYNNQTDSKKSIKEMIKDTKIDQLNKIEKLLSPKNMQVNESDLNELSNLRNRLILTLLTNGFSPRLTKRI